jgi:CubicO group peptidase (beta-lactamase class C family)
MNPRPEPGLAVDEGTALLSRPAGQRLCRYLGALIADGYPPSVSLAVVDSGSVLVACYGGRTSNVGGAVATSRRTVYDLASLTKVVCTVPLLMLAVQEGAMGLDDPVARWLPSFPVPGTTLRHLVSHTSGLVWHRPFFETLDGRPAIEAAVYREAQGTHPGTAVCYSDLNFMLLGWALESWAGQGLDKLFADRLSRPLGLGHTGFSPGPSLRRLTAATEMDGDQRRGKGLVWGEVHDGNAYSLGGVAGHAGLFAPLDDLCVLARSLLPSGTGPLSPASRAALGHRLAATDDDVRGVGWRLSPPAGWGTWPPGTFWHTGFTGTSMLVAPACDRAVVLLTNAVHPQRQLERQAQVRAQVHRLVSEVLG